MRKSRFTDEQIVGFLKQAEAGLPVKELCRKGGFSDATFYKWRARFGGMEASDARMRIATIFPFVEHVEAGGLMSYGADQKDWMRQSAVFVDKIFKGANPGELPIEQPAKIDLVINGKTATALGLKIPQTLLIQAARVIN